MNEILFQYEKVHPTTWAYLSSLLMIGLYFKFNRFWSVRNFDLLLLILLAPGLLLVDFGRQAEKAELRRAAQMAVVPIAPDDGWPTVMREEPAGAGATASVVAAREGGERSSAEEPLLLPGVGEDLIGAPPGLLQPETSLPVDEQQPAPPQSSEGPTDFASGEESTTPATADRPQSGAPTGHSGRSLQVLGYVWLLSVGALWLIRLLIDPTMVRRPLLEPNLSSGGLTFIGCSLFVFLMANVITSTPTDDDLLGPRSAEQLLERRSTEESDDSLTRHGPGYALLNLLPSIPTMSMRETTGGTQMANVAAAKTAAIVSHLAIVVGIVAIGYRHFDNVKMGIGVATLYLLLPYTAQMTGRVNHVLPAALLVWAVLCYRRPLTAGMFIGLAIGTVYYPLFLLPLWLSFYWQRGLMRFSIGVFTMLVVMVLSLAFISEDWSSFVGKFQQMFGIWRPLMDGLDGIWRLVWDPVYRIPVLAAFVALSCTFALWPAQKNLGTLMSCSGAMMVATQFWHGFGGGLYMAWYLPMVLLTIFRPNLEDRVALSVLGEGWLTRRRASLSTVEKAA